MSGRVVSDIQLGIKLFVIYSGFDLFFLQMRNLFKLYIFVLLVVAVIPVILVTVYMLHNKIYFQVTIQCYVLG